MSSELSYSERSLTIPNLKRKIAYHQKNHSEYDKLFPQYVGIESLIASGTKLSDDNLAKARQYLDIVIGMKNESFAILKFEKRLKELREEQQLAINRDYQTYKDFIDVCNKKRQADAPVDEPDSKRQRTQ